MIVITGAGGFIGSHLADALAKNDQQVLALDLPRAPPPNLRDAIASRAVTYRNCDVTRARSVERVLESGPET
ncbi:MAG: SDR family NAD(P)-dependent oxidoreductase, partial [Thermoplasmata archaeon]